jgi:hypothetical protein
MTLGEKGMDKPELDMMIVCEPLKRAAVFQQLTGRTQRERPGKQIPIVVFVEDPIGPCIAMCRVLKRYIKKWPADRGGPYDWRYIE